MLESKSTYEIVGKRNPVIIVKNGDTTLKIQIIGDPHLGRVFKNGVPRDRLGLREKYVYTTFKSLLNQKDIDIYIVVGDLFDKAKISNECFKQTAEILLEAAIENNTSQYYILSGNHDLNKDVDKVSSFTLLEQYFKNNVEIIALDNLKFMSTTDYYTHIEELDLSIYCSYYDPYKSVDELVDSLSFVGKDPSALKIAFGHWDTIEYQGEKFINRQVPSCLIESFDLIVTGHEHKPNQKVIQDKPILISGSMQPYAFNEEIEEDANLYVTLSLEDLIFFLEKDPNYFINNNVRVLYESTQELPPPFPCYSRSYKLITKDVKESIVNFEIDVENSSISFQKLFLEAITNNTTEDNQLFMKYVEQVFLEKSYNEST